MFPLGNSLIVQALKTQWSENVKYRACRQKLYVCLSVLFAKHVLVKLHLISGTSEYLEKFPRRQHVALNLGQNDRWEPALNLHHHDDYLCVRADHFPCTATNKIPIVSPCRFKFPFSVWPVSPQPPTLIAVCNLWP